jgi:hypothetical protein
MKRKNLYLLIPFVLLVCYPSKVLSQNQVLVKDTLVYRITYRDTVIYKHDTVRIRHFVYSDTVNAGYKSAIPKKKRLINPNAWGIGPSVGAYYSPFNGFDINLGFGVQYYFLAIPSFRNPHMKNKKAHR